MKKAALIGSVWLGVFVIFSGQAIGQATKSGVEGYQITLLGQGGGKQSGWYPFSHVYRCQCRNVLYFSKRKHLYREFCRL